MTRRDKDYIPKVGGSAIRKAKDTPAAAPKTKGGPAASGKKKRAPWDVKGRISCIFIRIFIVSYHHFANEFV